MAIYAIFPPGASTATANKSLYQWDYGQRLRIHSDDLPAVVEVHFAYDGLEEAIVRSCSIINGIGEVLIPDKCFEQSSTIVAWVYCIDNTSGNTEKKIQIPVKARTKPASQQSPPTEISNKYTEALTAMNEQVESLKDGSIVVEKARPASKADEAVRANKADEWMAMSSREGWTSYNPGETIRGGAFLLKYYFSDGAPSFTILDTDGRSTAYSGLVASGVRSDAMARIKATNVESVESVDYYTLTHQMLSIADDDHWSDVSGNPSISYKRLRTD